MNLNITEMSACQLKDFSRRYILSLTLEELQTVRDHFKEKGRQPTRLELECIAQTWSEHCNHKTMTGRVEYTENGNTKTYGNLLKETVFKPLESMDTGHCLSVFKDNAGIIKFTPGWGIAMKAETHNHPSAIEPYGGAATGVGGVIRDILGAGLGAKPVMNIDVFCFGDLDTPHSEIPEGVLHPRRVFRGVVKGVRDYSNRMGIPTSSGAIIFDEKYLYNPLVYCGTIGVIPEKCVDKQVVEGDIILAVGGKTGKDGLHGATFSSVGLDGCADSGCVQIGDPITEKQFADILLKLRDENLYNAVTDCGAGGFSSAVGEMGRETGAVVNLEKVTLKQKDMEPWEIFLSESQERMVLSVPGEKIERVRYLLESEDVGFAEIGKFGGGKLKVYYEDKLECELDMDFLHGGYPRTVRTALWTDKESEDIFVKETGPADVLMKIFSDPNNASKEKVIRQYDHEVQGSSVIRPLEGMDQDMPQDGCVIRPLNGSSAGIAVGLGINPFYGIQDPFRMAATVAEEAVRNAVSCGGDIRRAGLMDNFCWGDTEDPEILGELVRACQGCGDASGILKIPFISGKDSLNNFYSTPSAEKMNIPGTLLVTCVAPVENVEKACRSSFTGPGNLIYLAGETLCELGYSALSRSGFCSGGEVPALRKEISQGVLEFIRKCIERGLLRSCHDLSEGGLALAFAEMCFSGTGAEIDISAFDLKGRSGCGEMWAKLFSESNSRFLIEVSPGNAAEAEALADIPLISIGRTTENGLLQVSDGAKTVIKSPADRFKKVYTEALKW